MGRLAADLAWLQRQKDRAALVVRNSVQLQSQRRLLDCECSADPVSVERKDTTCVVEVPFSTEDQQGFKLQSWF